MIFRNNLDPSPIMHHLLLLRLLSLQPVDYYLQHCEQLLVPQPLVISFWNLPFYFLFPYAFLNVFLLIPSLQPVNTPQAGTEGGSTVIPGELGSVAKLVSSQEGPSWEAAS